MRIIVENAEAYIQALAVSVSCDPASLEAWRCLHIERPSAAREPVTTGDLPVKALQARFGDTDCDLILCPDGDIILIGHVDHLSAMREVEAALTGAQAADGIAGTIAYDLFHNWRQIRKLLFGKVGPAAPAPAYDDRADFGDVPALDEAFASAKNAGRARQLPHILLVEDDDMTRRLVCILFKDKHVILTARTAREAITSYLTHAPDIVFLDINLPDHNGFQVMKRILDQDPDAYVVMFSGNSYLDNITHALNAGASGFVAKPFSGEKMRRYIDDCALALHKSD